MFNNLVSSMKLLAADQRGTKKILNYLRLKRRGRLSNKEEKVIFSHLPVLPRRQAGDKADARNKKILFRYPYTKVLILKRLIYFDFEML
jgi:hypothetical protein